MLRSLFAGVSGLRNHQIQLDVIGNNIANVNTKGYKAARINFQENLSQAITIGARPNNNRGGINPLYVGIGMSIGSIDKIFTQGDFEKTGSRLDLAIQGDAFFLLSDGDQEFLTRAGNFTIDSDGYIVYGNTGLRAQGRVADVTGNITNETDIRNIALPFGQKAPAKVTTKVQLTGNLDSNTNKVSKILAASYAKTGDVTSTGTWADVIAANSAGLVIDGTNNKIDIVIDDDADGSITTTLTLTNGTYGTLKELVAEINNQIDATREITGEVVAEVVTDNGKDYLRIRTVDSGGSDTTITLSGSFTGATTTLNISGTGTGTTLTTSLTDIPFFEGHLTDGDVIKINGSDKGGYGKTGTFTFLADADGNGNPSTIGDLINAIDGVFPGAEVAIDDKGNITVIDTEAGASKRTCAISLTDANFNSITTPTFNTRIEGQDAGEHDTSILIYDSKGKPHTLQIHFTNISSPTDPDLWRWECTIDDDNIEPTGGNRGYMKFNPNGSLSAIEIADGLPLTFDPGEGSATMSINLDPGEAGFFNGLTQFNSTTSAVPSMQDGYGMGELYDFSFDETGTITGHFTNGVSQTIAQIAVATVNNPRGLEQVGENVFKVGANSGMPVRGWAGSTIQAEIAPEHLEMSNVDLAEEFAKMIIAQRGFQANSRVITTSDTLLDEIVRLKR